MQIVFQPLRDQRHMSFDPAERAGASLLKIIKRKFIAAFHQRKGGGHATSDFYKQPLHHSFTSLLHRQSLYWCLKKKKKVIEDLQGQVVSVEPGGFQLSL